MLELLVILMCLGGEGCNSALSEYKVHSPETYKRLKRKTESMVYNNIDKEVVVTVGSFIGAATKQNIKLRVYNGLVLAGDYEDFMLTYKLNF